MFEPYSERARRVIFLTRRRAGQRGAAALDIDHLVQALVLEDQGKFADEMGEPRGAFGEIATSVLRPSVPFFAPQTASAILVKLEQVLPQGKAIPDQEDMPISSALGRAFDDALTLKTELHHEQVEPLHLLAAALAEPSSQASEALLSLGITKEVVMNAMKGGESP